MLSADGKDIPDTLVDLAHKIPPQEGAQPRWLTTPAESGWYHPLKTFLNNCVEACHSALDCVAGNVSRDKRWYGDLKFIVYDVPTEDGVDGSPKVKPDLVGGLDLDPVARAAWSPRGQNTNQVLLPVEVKKEWLPMVTQAATYARCLFSASPSRQFALVLGFQHVGKGLRFLVFHRSGLTASKSLSVDDEQGQKDILRIFLSILRWKSTNDAGFLEFYNDIEMCLPRHENDKTGVVATVAEVLHDGLCVLGRASRVLLMRFSPHPGEERRLKDDPAQGPASRTRARVKRKTRTNQGGETRMSFHALNA